MSFYLFLLLLCFFIPLFGIVISLFIMGALDKLSAKSHQHAEILEARINLEEVIPFGAKYGEGGVTMHLFKQESSSADRVDAFFVLSQMQLRNINKLVFKLLPDDIDEMRLLAFNILEGQEDTITRSIHRSLSLLETKNIPPERYAQFEKDVALQYWELIYNHLISPELEDSILKKAEAYAVSALNFLTNDATLWILLGRIYKHTKHYVLAEKAFNQAILADISPAQVLPYLAEIRYELHDYLGVQNYLSKSETLLDIAQVAPVKIFWEEE